MGNPIETPSGESAASKRESGESPASKSQAARPTATEETRQMVVTIGATTGEVVKVEKIDKTGKRDELSEKECAKLAGEDEVDEIEAALEEAFEVGIEGALSEDDESEDLDDEEQALRRLLIGGLLRRRPVLGRLRRQSVQRLLLRRLLRRRLLQSQLHR